MFFPLATILIFSLDGEQSTPPLEPFFGGQGLFHLCLSSRSWLSNLTVHRNNPRCLLRMLIPRLLRVSDSVGWWWSQDLYILIKLLRRLWCRGSPNIMRNSVLDLALPLPFFASFSYSLHIPGQSHPFPGLQLPYICLEYLPFYNSDSSSPELCKFKTSVLTHVERPCETKSWAY